MINKKFDKFIILNGAIIPAKKYIKHFSGTSRIDSEKPKGMSEEKTENITKSDTDFAPAFVDYYIFPAIYFNGDLLIKKNVSIRKEVINLNSSYKLNPQLRTSHKDFTITHRLFGSVNLTKNDDLDKHKYSAYGTRFDSHSEFFFYRWMLGKKRNYFRN